MEYEKFARLVDVNVISQEKLSEIMCESATRDGNPVAGLITEGIPKHAILQCLSRLYGLPFVEYDERLMVPAEIIKKVNLEQLKRSLWFPLSVDGNRARIIAYDPRDPVIMEEAQRFWRVDKIDFLLALPSDIVRFIENHQDINPNYTPGAGRTPLARVRTYLAEYRTLLAWYRTFLAKGRTGLAFMRTGFSFISIALVLIRIFGIGYLTAFEAVLLLAGATMAVDGFMWYLPTRKIIKKRLQYAPTEPTFGSTFLELANGGLYPTFNRVGPIKGAEALRSRWNRLTPVMRRRFFAIDRTDLADERTILGYYRTIMAQARTGLAFTRTGVGFVGLGTALLKQFALGWWTFFDGALLLMGAVMMIEGFHWYIPGRRASQKSHESVHRMRIKTSVRDFMFPPVYRSPSGDDLPSSLFTDKSHAPGIWGTTGLALERTLLADRRNVKARLRTVMARSRTGLAFIRTGTSVFAVGLGLLVYFGAANLFFAIFNIILVLAGLALIVDGYYWHLPAERMKKEFPYCLNEMEIAFPNYASPSLTWKKVVFRP